MSEVRRSMLYASPVAGGMVMIEATPELRAQYPEAKVYVEDRHLDRVTAENSALQARLTAADERVDALEGQIASAYETAAKWVEKRCDAYVDEHGSSDPETSTIEFPGDGEEYVGELMEIADGLRALKPAEGGGDE